jgi:hypothetical protein
MRKLLKDIDVDERIILKWILKKQDRVVRTGFCRLKVGTSGGLL